MIDKTGRDPTLNRELVSNEDRATVDPAGSLIRKTADNLTEAEARTDEEPLWTEHTYEMLKKSGESPLGGRENPGSERREVIGSIDSGYKPAETTGYKGETESKVGDDARED